MSFWAYMLHCHGGRFYVGHTDDLERRVAQHRSGAIAGFTADHLPVEFVWSQAFPTRDEAKAAERQIKGWSRAKKLALIRGDWGLISERAKKKDSASTSSAWTGEGDSSAPNPARPELVEGSHYSLQAHPAAPPLAVSALSARIIRLDANWLTLRWKVESAGQVVLPPFAGRKRTDGLWQTTCFEFFVKAPGAEAYAEFNLSPSERWAAYDFAGYREGMVERPVPRAPVCTPRRGGSVLIFDAAIPAGALPPLPWDYGLTAVIEEAGGHKSYWAIAHPAEKPDFHHPTCFAAQLAAPERP
jgi:hypothetical protein